MRTLQLKSGDKMPILGFGTFRLNGETCKKAVKKALELGYRHIDTADAYDNQQDIAIVLKKVGIPREELFITSKIWRDNLKYQDVLTKGERILQELQIEYLDLLLIHWPNKNIPLDETLRALKELKTKGLVKNIGVSNFTINHLKDALKIDAELVTVNQVEFHPYLNQQELLTFCQDHGIVLTAYSPLARGKIFKDREILNLANKYHKKPEQLVLKWAIEKDIVVIPKASSGEHIISNMQLFDWELPEEAKKKLDGLNRMERSINPDFAEFNY